MSRVKTFFKTKTVNKNQFSNFECISRKNWKRSNSIQSRQLTTLSYLNKMYDSLVYYDTVTVWLKGYEIVQFQIKIERPKLELLAANDPSTAEGRVNENVTIIIKTFLRYPCLFRLLNSIRKFYPLITIIIADDRKRSCSSEFWLEKTDSLWLISYEL